MNKYTVDPVWYVRESLKLAFPSYIPQKERIVASLYTAFLDESGIHKSSKLVAVGGFISNVPKTEELCREWKEALDLWQIPMFHMADFESSQGDFSSWANDKDKHKKCLNHLLDIIKRNTFNSIAFVVDRDSINRIFSQKVKTHIGGAYGLASIGCWHKLGLITKDSRIDGYIRCTMEKGAEGAGALLKIYKEESKDPNWVTNTRVLGLSFEDKRLFLPLQAADILAYEVFKQAKRQLQREIRDTRYPLKQLAKPGHRWHYATDKQLEEEYAYLASIHWRGC